MAFYGRVLDDSNVNPGNLNEVRASHAKALICKATEGLTFKDVTYAQSRVYAKALGIRFGSYLFLRPLHPGDSQAKAYMRYARPALGDIQPIIDAETQDGKSWLEIARCVDECANELEKNGYRPILYGSTSFLRQLYAVAPHLKRLRAWQAEYPSFLPRTIKQRLRRRSRFNNGVSVVMWQYSSRWPVLGRYFDGSYLLQPIQNILIGGRAGGGAKRLAA